MDIHPSQTHSIVFLVCKTIPFPFFLHQYTEVLCYQVIRKVRATHMLLNSRMAIAAFIEFTDLH